ncbi:hypothetical protein E4U17_001343 [Claviceps sp. LM77 group G4]|nr:hypothetical protein E4U17_001343 [Claviceps sp. LM77 group G4]
MPRAIRGVLVECDPSIKSIIVNIDSENHDFIIEDLDEERVVVKENMVPLLKQKLEDVRAPAATTESSPINRLAWPLCVPHLRSDIEGTGQSPDLHFFNWQTTTGRMLTSNRTMQRLKENLPPIDDSGSDA